MYSGFLVASYKINYAMQQCSLEWKISYSMVMAEGIWPALTLHSSIMMVHVYTVGGLVEDLGHTPKLPGIYGRYRCWAASRSHKWKAACRRILQQDLHTCVQVRFSSINSYVLMHALLS